MGEEPDFLNLSRKEMDRRRKGAQKKSSMVTHGAFRFITSIQDLHLDNFGGLRTFLSLGHFKTDLLTFFEGLESFILNL